MSSPTGCAGICRRAGLRHHAAAQGAVPAILLPPGALAARRRPKSGCLALVREQLGPDYDMQTHFTPRYNPWEQRLCLVPDNDMFLAIRAGKASVVTDTIETFTENGDQARLRQRARSRHHHHRDRPELADARRRGRLIVDGEQGRYRQALRLQGRDVFGRAELRLRVRLHQRVVDAARRSDLRICLPAGELSRRLWPAIR